MTTKISRRLLAVATGFLATAALATAPARANEAAAKKWIDKEFQPSTLNKQQQLAELQWFIKAAAQLKARGVKVLDLGGVNTQSGAGIARSPGLDHRTPTHLLRWHGAVCRLQGQRPLGASQNP